MSKKYEIVESDLNMSPDDAFFMRTYTNYVKGVSPKSGKTINFNCKCCGNTEYSAHVFTY